MDTIEIGMEGVFPYIKNEKSKKVFKSNSPPWRIILSLLDDETPERLVFSKKDTPYFAVLDLLVRTNTSEFERVNGVVEEAQQQEN